MLQASVSHGFLLLRKSLGLAQEQERGAAALPTPFTCPVGILLSQSLPHRKPWKSHSCLQPADIPRGEQVTFSQKNLWNGPGSLQISGLSDCCSWCHIQVTTAVGLSFLAYFQAPHSDLEVSCPEFPKLGRAWNSSAAAALSPPLHFVFHFETWSCCCFFLFSFFSNFLIPCGPPRAIPRCFCSFDRRQKWIFLGFSGLQRLSPSPVVFSGGRKFLCLVSFKFLILTAINSCLVSFYQGRFRVFYSGCVWRKDFSFICRTNFQKNKLFKKWLYRVLSYP